MIERPITGDYSQQLQEIKTNIQQLADGTKILELLLPLEELIINKIRDVKNETAAGLLYQALNYAYNQVLNYAYVYKQALAFLDVFSNMESTLLQEIFLEKYHYKTNELFTENNIDTKPDADILA